MAKVKEFLSNLDFLIISGDLITTPAPQVIKEAEKMFYEGLLDKKGVQMFVAGEFN